MSGVSPEPLIELRDLRRDYKMGDLTVHALRGLDLRIDRGEFVVLLGPSGCGKTTTLNLLGGLDRPTGGSVIVDGEDIARYDERQLTAYRRRKVGFIFQFFNLIPTLTAAENVELALALVEGDGKKQRHEAVELLSMVGLEERAGHFPSQLSGGEQQRVAVARALATHPPLILCDEPTGNLDIATGQQVLQVIRNLNKQEGSTVLLVSHNTAIAPIADRVVRMRDGMIDHVETNAHPVPVAQLVW